MSDKINNEISEPQLRKLVAELPEQYKDVVLVFFLNKMTKKALAETLGLSYGVARNRLSKGIYLLKKISDTELFLS